MSEKRERALSLLVTEVERVKVVVFPECVWKLLMVRERLLSTLRRRKEEKTTEGATLGHSEGAKLVLLLVRRYVAVLGRGGSRGKD